MADPILCVVVARARGTRLADTLTSLEGQTYPDLHVVVAAPEGVDVPRVAAVVRVPERTGYPDAVRLAIERSATRTPFVLLLHDDVVLDPHAVEAMVQMATSDEAIAAVGAKLVEWDDPVVLQEVGGGIDRFAHRRSALDAGEIDAGQRDDTVDVLYCSDACLLVRADQFTELGGLDPGAWPLYEDVDLCWRLRASGKRVVVASQARARHAALLSRDEDFDLSEADERGRLRFMIKHFGAIGLIVLLPQAFIAALIRVLVAAVRREFWRVRSTVGAYMRVLREMPALLRARRATPRRVDDRELLALGARSAILERRGERAEWLSQVSTLSGRVVDRMLTRTRDPASWATVVAVIIVLLVLRSVIFGGTFLLGELRALPTFGEAMSNLFASARNEGLDPFAPATPGLVALGVLRTLALRPALAQKLAILLPLAAAAAAGARVAGVLSLGDRGRRLVAIAAAVNPATVALLRDGELGALVMWAGSLWLGSSLLAPSSVGGSRGERIRFYARWAIGWSVVVALHPPAMIWLVMLGATVTVARHVDGRTEQRVQALAAGVVGSLVLLAPWSIEWFTTRTPLVGRPGWLVAQGWSGLDAVTFGAGWPLVAWLVVAVAGAYFVGLTRTALALVGLIGAALLLGAGGAMPGTTMLAAGGSAALLLIALESRRVSAELPRQELGRRQALVVAGVVVLSIAWVAAAVGNIAAGARRTDVPLITSTAERTGRVLWLAQTSGGLRSWTTLGFSQKLAGFPAASGPAEELVSEALEAGRGGRTHRVGGVLALADVSHVVALDEASARGLDEQANLAPIEIHDHAIVYRNDGWRGPVMLLPSPPSAPLTPTGLADVVRSPQRVAVRGWPYGPISFDVPPDADGVVYVAGGPRRGWNVEGAKGRLSGAGLVVDASAVEGTVEASPPRALQLLVPVIVVLAVVLLFVWAAAAYTSRPPQRREAAAPSVVAVSSARPALVVPVVALLAGVALGWTGFGVGAGGGFLSSAWYCPPVGAGFRQLVAIANANQVDVEYQVRDDLATLPRAEGSIGQLSRETVNIEPDQGAVVESFGYRLAVASQVQRRNNRDSSLCSSFARERNLFPEGGRAATRARPRLFERYVIFNPFADVARASVRFISPDEPPISPPSLRDVQVKPGRFVVVNPEEQFEPMLDLSTIVTVWQGRAIVARRLQTIEQVSWSLGRSATTGGVLPRAITQDAVTAIIAVNPSDEASRVTVRGAGGRGSIPEERFEVSPGSRSTFELNALAPDVSGLVVSLEASVPVAMESLVLPERRSELSLLPPLRPERRWVVPLAERRKLVITNPNPSVAAVTLVRLGPGPAFQSFEVGANRTKTISLAGRSAFGVEVRADRPVTAAVIGSAGAMAGVPG